jgi:hypothetical protein
MVPEEAESFERIRAAGMKRAKALFDEAAAAVVPVPHTLKVEPAPPEPAPKQ